MYSFLSLSYFLYVTFRVGSKVTSLTINNSYYQIQRFSSVVLQGIIAFCGGWNLGKKPECPASDGRGGSRSYRGLG